MYNQYHMKRKRKAITEEEKQQLDKIVEPYLNPVVHHLGEESRGVARYDKRVEMYGGKGTVYLLQLFNEAELVNNRIAAYMILPEKGVSAGFHTHGTRREQELYIVMSGSGEYHEKNSAHAEIRSVPIKKGSVTSVRGEAHHSVTNLGDEPLIIFVITTNESAIEST